MAKNTTKKSMGKDGRKKVFFFLNFLGQKILTWTSLKKVFLVFLNSPVEKRTKAPPKKYKN
jgi:hypothetical protein